MTREKILYRQEIDLEDVIDSECDAAIETCDFNRHYCYLEYLANGMRRYCYEIHRDHEGDILIDYGEAEELPWRPKEEKTTTLDKLSDKHLRNIRRIVTNSTKWKNWKRECYLAGIDRILSKRQVKD